MHIEMHDALKMREHRHARLVLHARHEALSTARHDHIDVAIETREHRPHGRAVGRGNQGYCFRRQAGGFEPRDETSVNDGRRAQTVGAAAQDRGVA